MNPKRESKMASSKSREAGKELFKFVPGTVRLLNVVAESYEDKNGLEIAEEILKRFEKHNKKEEVQNPANEMMLVQGVPFYERLDFCADKLDIRTFTYLPSEDNHTVYAEKARGMQEQVIRHLVGESGVVVAFPKSGCPRMIRPMREIETLKYRTWGAVAMAIKLGIPVYVYVPRIHNERAFLGPIVSRGKLLSQGEWGAWVMMTATTEDMSEETKMTLQQGDGVEMWVEGIPSRPNFFRQN
jgi:hypothetical protein